MQTSVNYLIMKTLILATLVLLTFALNAQQKVIVRLDNPSLEQFKHFRTTGWDLASVSPGKYLDLMVSHTEFDQLRSEGYDFRIVQTTDEMAANLRGTEKLPGYRTYAQALAELQQIELNHPGICKLYNVGDSRGKEYYNAGNNNYVSYQHDVWALKVSSNVLLDEDKPAIYYMGAHHAREPISTEVVFHILNHILQNYGTDPDITHSVNTKEIWFIPIVNPDGHRIVLEEIDLSWRKNIRDNDGNGQITLSSGWNYPDGVDPNRNYGWEWGGEGASSNPTNQTYRGPEAFSEPEIVAMQQLLADRHFVAGLNYHSYSELVLWPFGYTTGATAPDAIALAALGTAMGQSIPTLSGGGHYNPQPSWALYPASGGTDDYAYGQHGIFSYCVELATQFIPPASQVLQVCQDNLQAAMIILNRIDHSTLTGIISNSQNGTPVVAEIYIDGIDNTGLYREPYKSNETFGRYYRMLPNGNYTVTISSYGYITQTFNNITINNQGQTILNVELVPAQILSLSGMVSDNGTGLPIEGASVQLVGTPLDPVFTNSAGEYAFADVFENTYTFRVYAPEYITIMQDFAVNQTNNVINFELFPAVAESFESGVFGDGWTFSGNQPWLIDNSVAWDGNNSARSGTINHNQSSSMIYTMETVLDGVISFYLKVSSEDSYDFLRFYINDEMKGQWSGEVDWTEVSFPVPAGLNAFRWTYVKDPAVVAGSDRAWVDYIIFPLSANCSPPANLAASNVSINSASLSWDDNPDIDLWDLAWGLAGFNPQSQGTVVEGLTGTTYELEGLLPATAYNFYVRAHCADGGFSLWQGPEGFSTLCDVYDLPFGENFATGSVECWSHLPAQGNWAFGNLYTPPSSVSGAPNAYFSGQPALQNYSFALVSPILDATDMSDIKMSYYLYINSVSGNTLEQLTVEYKPVSSGNWLMLEIFSNAGIGSGSQQFMRFDQALTGVQGQQFQVRFRAHGINSANIQGWGLDDVNFTGEGTTAGISIWADNTQLCEGDNVVFTAVPVNGGDNPIFQWFVNGDEVGDNSPAFSFIPDNSDMVSCELTSNMPGVTGSPVMSEVVALTVFDLPLVSWDSTPYDTICYFWGLTSLSGGFPEGGEYSGPGVIDNTIDPELAGLGSHILSYTYTDGNGCSATAYIEIFIDVCAGLKDNTPQKFFRIYPNPARDVLKIEFTESAGEIKMIRFYDLFGRVVFSETTIADDKVQEVSLHHFPKGVYILEIITESHSLFDRVIVY
jgi:carboxypeptidase T